MLNSGNMCVSKCRDTQFKSCSLEDVMVTQPNKRKKWIPAGQCY
jgi:hypothetical protein